MNTKPGKKAVKVCTADILVYLFQKYTTVNLCSEILLNIVFDQFVADSSIGKPQFPNL